MKRILLVVLIWLGSIPQLLAQDTVSRPVQMEINGGPVLRTDYIVRQPDVSTAVKSYWFSGGWEYTLGMVVPLKRRFAIAVRWKQAVFLNDAGNIATVFFRAYPGTFSVTCGNWKIHQINMGALYQFRRNRMRLLLGQHLGISLVEIPSLEIRGQEQGHITRYITRAPQQHRTFALSTTLSLQYHYSSRRYLFFQSEWSRHYTGSRTLELESVFGVPEMGTGISRKWIRNYSMNVGVGWNLIR